jgi:SAM-dependent methyltransferase
MTGLSPRLAEIVAALPLLPSSRVLEIGCGTGAAARAVAARLTTGHILAIDRSAKAIAQARAGSAEEIASGRMSVRQVPVEEFTLQDGEELFDLAFAVRVGALDGRHPEAGRLALQRLSAALKPGAFLFIDGGRPLRKIPLPPS